MTAVEPSGPPAFQVDVAPDRQRVLVSPVGELDLATAPALELAVTELLDDDFAHVVIDLRETTFLDSSGIKALIGADAYAKERGAHVSVLRGAAEGVRRPLELAGLDDHLDLVDR